MADDEAPPEPGFVERAIAAELEALGYTPLTQAGPLLTAATRALAMARSYDLTNNAAALPGLDRRLAEVMDEARRASEPSPIPKPEEEESEVSEFERRRRERGTGTDG